VVAALSHARSPNAYFDGLPSGVVVLAHQGGDGLWPSNTMYAFRHAVDAGADVLELDVHETSDRAIVVIHDDTVDRTTDGSGAVESMTLAQVQALDAGYRWSPGYTYEGGGNGDFPYRGQGIHIPTLQEVFDAFPGEPVNIEIKPDSPAVARDLCDLIERNDRELGVLVVSFNSAPLAAFRRACPTVATGGSAGEIRTFFLLERARLARLVSPSADTLQAPIRQGSLRVVSRHFVSAAHARGLRVDAWTVNDEGEMRDLVAMGVDGIITDRPDRALRVLRRGGSVPLPAGVAP
jgi:glycerophosphoryl diester phosphodiesterase